MDVTGLEKDLQKLSRKCFESFKNDVLNCPIDNLTNEQVIEFALNNSLLESFRGSFMTKYMSSNLSNKQLRFYQDKVNEYQNLTIRIAKNWANKYF